MSDAVSRRTATLATMYQRIPGHVQHRIQSMVPLSYAVLEFSAECSLSDAALAAANQRTSVHARWRKVEFPGRVSVPKALAAVEKANGETARLQKIQINFYNGSHMILSRTRISDPGSLTCEGLYDPSGVFVDVTAPRVAVARQDNERAIKTLTSDKGHSHKTRSAPLGQSRNGGKLNAFAPETLYRNHPEPTVGKDGYAFTPVSSMSYQQRPNVVIPGVRAPLCNTNPVAVQHRPRPLSKPLGQNVFDEINPRNLNRPPGTEGKTGTIAPGGVKLPTVVKHGAA